MAAENLYIVQRTILDPKNPREVSFTVSFPAAFTDLRAAKEEAKLVLINEGYDTELLPIYQINDGLDVWKYGDRVIVYAEGPSGEIFNVSIATIPNLGLFESDKRGRVLLPLYYVVQTIIHYDLDPSGTRRDVIIEGAYSSRALALEQALNVLLDDDVTRGDFTVYEEYRENADWPFGADVVVHAVKESGKHFLVSVI